MPEISRRRIAVEAAGQAKHRPWVAGLRGFGLWSPSPGPGFLATAVAAVIALVLLPVALRRSPAPYRESAVKVEVESHGSAVLLAWTDGSRDSYTVYKTSDPRNLRRAEVHRVKGNSWVDENPGSSQVVFYRIE